MAENWRGKAVSIECDNELGIFQGVIKTSTESHITIGKAFRNGVPLKIQNAEITLNSSDIKKINLLPEVDGQNTTTPTVINKQNPLKKSYYSNPVRNSTGLPSSQAVPAYNNNQTNSNQKQQRTYTSKGENPKLVQRFNTLDVSSRTPNKNVSNDLPAANGTNDRPRETHYQSSQTPSSNSVAQFFGRLIPPKVEVLIGATSVTPTTTEIDANSTEINDSIASTSSSKPIDIPNSSNGSYYGHSQSMASSSTNNSNGKMRNMGYSNGYGNGNGSNGNKKNQRRNFGKNNWFKKRQTFETSADDPDMHEEFDFESNLALFDKEALWNDIESSEQRAQARQVENNPEPKYRHDENIIESKPLELRQIQSSFASYSEYLTDDGLIIPTIPMYVRTKIENISEKSGMLLSRQNEILARGVCDLAILLLGGARRLTPNNSHQWPKIAIICEARINARSIDIGAITGRQLASHGLNVTLYLDDEVMMKQNTEIKLFQATENKTVGTMNEIPSPDLVILSTNSSVLAQSVKTWLKETRASILAIDPPPNGVPGVSIKYSILPILPLNGISTNNCGKLYLCNLGIPDIYFREAGVKYKSPFGHKSILPIHLKD